MPADASVISAVRAVYLRDPFVFAAACIHPRNFGHILRAEVIRRFNPMIADRLIGSELITGTDYPYIVRIAFSSGVLADYPITLFDGRGGRWANVNDCHGWYRLGVHGEAVSV
jgi:hypothetical protein